MWRLFISEARGTLILVIGQTLNALETNDQRLKHTTSIGLSIFTLMNYDVR